MKTLILKKTLIVLVIFTFESCEKKVVQSMDQTLNKPTVNVLNSANNNDRVGEEEEEEIIAGRLIDSTGVIVPNTRIEIVNNSSGEIDDHDYTSSSGEFEFVVLPGEYFFRIHLSSNWSIDTNPIQVVESIQILIEL